MLPEMQYHPVNWVDGMKISKKQFIEFENFVTDQARDAVGLQLNNYAYGLIPAPANNQPSLELQIHCDHTQQVGVKLLTCRAVTANGSRIEIVRKEGYTLNTSLNQLLSEFNLPAAKEQL